MKILILVKKDILLMKKYLIFILAFTILAPPLLNLVGRWNDFSIHRGLIIFMYVMVVALMTLLQSANVEEDKYPKAAALLTAIPYSRKDLVIAKYVCLIVMYFILCTIFQIIGFIVPAIGTINFTIVLEVFIGLLLFYGIYLPFYFKYGFGKTRFFYIIIIFGLCFGAPSILPYLMNLNIDLSFIMSLSPILINLILFLLSIIIIGISILFSFMIYENKEL